MDHTEENQANWISEIMYEVTPEKTSRGIVSADYSFMDGIFIWTYRNGLNQICDREGNPVSEPVATSPALPYVQCKRLRQK